MRRNSLRQADPSDPPGGLDNETFERADRKRDAPGESDDRAAARDEPTMGEGEGEDGDAPGKSDSAHEPAEGLDDPRVSAVPKTIPRPGESETQAAARLRRGGQDAWGSPEDQPDHDSNEVYVQQDDTHA
jgi:hypothetical protein